MEKHKGVLDTWAENASARIQIEDAVAKIEYETQFIDDDKDWELDKPNKGKIIEQLDRIKAVL